MAEYIDRGALLEMLGKKIPSLTRSIIEYFPAADVEPVLRSEWVAQCVLPGDGWAFEDVPYDPHQHCGPLCKRCRKTALLNGGEDYVCSNCCPNCGARMERGTDA